MKNYEIIEHTADVGIRVKGKDLKDLFRKAALAISDISSEKITKDKKIKTITIRQKAENLDELFVNWLNELLSLSAVKELIFEDAKIKKLDNTCLEATVSGSNIKNYKVNTEIKAATYHDLKLEQTRSGYVAEVIFDV